MFYLRLMELNFAVDYRSMLSSDFMHAAELLNLNNISNV